MKFISKKIANLLDSVAVISWISAFIVLIIMVNSLKYGMLENIFLWICCIIALVVMGVLFFTVGELVLVVDKLKKDVSELELEKFKRDIDNQTRDNK